MQATRKLYPYFQAHTIKVVTDQPLQQTLSKFNVVGRMLKWLVELGEFDVQYILRTTTKVQALVNFISELAPMEEDSAPVHAKERYTVYIDGSTNAKRGGVGLILKGPNDQLYEHALHFKCKATNNEAKYEALLSRF